MSMKSILMATAMIGLVSVSGMNAPHRGQYIPAPRLRKYGEYFPLSDKMSVPTDIPKGHTTEPVTFEFMWQDHILRMNCTISYGTKSSRFKKIASVKGELAEYIKNTPLSKIKEFGQFQIEEIEKVPIKDLKGELHGNCNRTSCQAPGANYYNHSTKKHYCKGCAMLINAHNQEDALRLYGHELCTLVKNIEPQP